MPTYSYRCPKCGHEFEKLQKMSDRTRARCPKCRVRGERKISGGAGLVFKGSGFYITDYKRSGEKKGAGEDSAGKKADAAASKPSKSKGAES